MLEDIKYWRNQLKEDLLRLKELQTLKNNACSEFDLMMGYNWRFSACLKKNHILYDICQIRKLRKNEQLSLFDN